MSLKETFGSGFGIREILIGFSIAGFLYPIAAPRNVSGNEIPNQIKSNSSKDVKGTTPELSSPRIRRLMIKNMKNAIPGNKNAVPSAFCFQCTPPNIL